MHHLWTRVPVVPDKGMDTLSRRQCPAETTMGSVMIEYALMHFEVLHRILMGMAFALLVAGTGLVLVYVGMRVRG